MSDSFSNVLLIARLGEIYQQKVLENSCQIVALNSMQVAFQILLLSVAMFA